MNYIFDILINGEHVLYVSEEAAGWQEAMDKARSRIEIVAHPVIVDKDGTIKNEADNMLVAALKLSPEGVK